MNYLVKLVSLSLLLAACGDDATGGDGGEATNTIVDIVVANPDFETLESAVIAADLVDTLSGEGPFTVFAPTDDAFALLPDGVVAGLDQATLAQILKYHVVSGAVPAADAIGLTSATSVEGTDIQLSTTGSNLYLNGLTLVTSVDIEADNGIIHVIDSVILPIDFPGNLVEAASAYPRLSSAVTSISNSPTALGAVQATAGATIFAPINQAFTDANVDLTADSSNVLLYHAVGSEIDSAAATAAVGTALTMVNSGTVNVVAGPALEDEQGNTRNLVSVDLKASNGIIHAIDGLLLQ